MITVGGQCELHVMISVIISIITVGEQSVECSAVGPLLPFQIYSAFWSVFFCCIFSCTVCISQVIGCEDHIVNDASYAGWNVKLYSNSDTYLHVSIVSVVKLASNISFISF